MNLHAFESYLFDLDGTLILSNEQHAKAWHEALKLHGCDVPMAVVRPLIGMGGDKIIPRLLGIRHDAPLGKRISEDRKQIYDRMRAEIKPCAGARDLLLFLRAQGKKTGIVTSGTQDDLSKGLAIAGVEDLMDIIICADDVELSKPSADPLHAALQKGHLKPAEVLYVGDTPYDIEAAALAEIRTAILQNGGWELDYLTGAAAVYENPEHFLHFLRHL